MKKILSIVALSFTALVLTTGCSSSMNNMSAHIEKGNETIPQSAIYAGHHKSEDMMKAIKKAGEKEGWRVTEFKSNAVIVEKVLGDKTVSSTLEYRNEHIYGDDENAPMNELLNLRQAIVDELQKEQKAH